MTYLVRAPTRAIRSIAALTGILDAQLGYSAVTEDGDIYLMINTGWVKVYDHETGPVTPVVPLPSNQATVTDGAAMVVPVTGTYVDTITATVVDGSVTGFALS